MMDLAISLSALILAIAGGYLMGYDRGLAAERRNTEKTIDKHVLAFGDMISVALQDVGVGRLDVYKTEQGMGVRFMSARDEDEAVH